MKKNEKELFLLIAFYTNFPKDKIKLIDYTLEDNKKPTVKFMYKNKVYELNLVDKKKNKIF